MSTSQEREQEPRQSSGQARSGHRGPTGGPERAGVEIDGRHVRLSNPDKVLYPATGFTKGQVIDYYERISAVLVPHLTDRPLTVVRYPNGVTEKGFFTKNAPSHRPEWTTTARLPSPGSTKDRSTIDYLVATDRPTMVWLANLAALELHTPMWRISTGRPDLVVADLDPGPGTSVVDCARVALLLREILPGPLGVKTSGSKGLQIYGRVTDGRTSMQVRADMRTIAGRLAADHPQLVVANMRKDLRGGRVLLDWSQNNPAKTTVSVYSLRARERPTVSTPVTWAEVENCRRPQDLDFSAGDVLRRVDELGDLFAPLLGDPVDDPG